MVGSGGVEIVEVESGRILLQSGREEEMGDETAPCRFHGGLAIALQNVDNRTVSVESKISEIQQTVAAQGAYSKEHTRQLDALFQASGAIQSAIDQNIAHSSHRDKQLSEIKELTSTLTTAIETVQATVENGLNERVEALSKTIHGEDGLVNQVEKMVSAVSMLAGCMQRRKEEAERIAAEEAEFSAYKKFFKGIARNLTRLWKENTVIAVIFLTWLLFAEGGIGYKIHLILSFLGIVK